jgi:hypothetical protein
MKAFVRNHVERGCPLILYLLRINRGWRSECHNSGSACHGSCSPLRLRLLKRELDCVKLQSCFCPLPNLSLFDPRLWFQPAQFDATITKNQWESVLTFVIEVDQMLRCVTRPWISFLRFVMIDRNRDVNFGFWFVSLFFIGCFEVGKLDIRSNFLSCVQVPQTTDKVLKQAHCLPLREPTLDLWMEITKSRKFVIQRFISNTKFYSRFYFSPCHNSTTRQTDESWFLQMCSIPAKNTIRGRDDQLRLISPGARVIISSRPCSGTLRWNCPDVQVARALASTKQVASALATCTSGKFQQSNG